MENKLICPMSFCIQMGTIKYLFCEKEKCAWWDNFYKQCVVCSISTDLCCLDGKFYSKEKSNGKE